MRCFSIFHHLLATQHPPSIHKALAHSWLSHWYPIRIARSIFGSFVAYRMYRSMQCADHTTPLAQTDSLVTVIPPYSRYAKDSDTQNASSRLQPWARHTDII